MESEGNIMKRILISACLLGVPCRYDGKAKPYISLEKLLQHGIEAIPVCPECDGGLTTPRVPAERLADRVMTRDGKDVTEAYRCGARHALALAEKNGCTHALLKERSPSCGGHEIYDGSFTGRLIPGAGVTAELLVGNGIVVFGESDLSDLLLQLSD